MYEVIAEFVDKRDGSRVLPGQPLPELLKEETVRRLVKAGCLRRTAAQPGLLGDAPPAKKGTKSKAPKKAAAEGGQAQPGFLPDDDSAPLAGGDGGGDGERPESDGGGHGAGEGQS